MLVYPREIFHSNIFFSLFFTALKVKFNEKRKWKNWKRFLSIVDSRSKFKLTRKVRQGRATRNLMVFQNGKRSSSERVWAFCQIAPLGRRKTPESVGRWWQKQKTKNQARVLELSLKIVYKLSLTSK